MKKIFIIAALFIGAITCQTAKAQVNVHLSLNIGSQPDWGPVGYDHVDYYYLPDVDAYYYVPTHQYVYYENNVWVHRTYLPVRYRNYNLYNGYKVVINQPNPWLRNTYYRGKYASYRGKPSQVIIRDSHDVKYVNHWKGPAHHAPKPRGPEHHAPAPHGPEHHGPEHHAPEHHAPAPHGPDRHDNGHHDNGKHGGGHGHGKH